MRYVQLCIAVIAITLAGSVPATAGKKAPIRPGEWQTTIHVQMAGMPAGMGMAIPPIITNSCVTEKDLVPNIQRPGEKCEVLKQKITGSTVDWKVQCQTEQGKVTGTGKATYKAASYTGTMDMVMEGEQGMKMTYHMAGKRVGPCEKAKAK